MKRLVSAALALSLLGGTAAAAAPYDNGARHYRARHGDNGAAVAAGIGLLALVAILASQQHQHRHYHRGWYNRDGRDYDNGYARSYGYQQGDYYDGYGDNQRRW